MDLTTSVANEFRDERTSIDRRPKINADYGINSVHNHNDSTANCNYHVYLNDVSSKDMIIRNPVQIPSSMPPATSPTTPAIGYPQRPIWNGIGQTHLQQQLPSSPVHADSASNSAMYVDSTPSTLVLPTLKKRKRTPQPIPEECKDGAYWERRKRNNESAKRSREMRRVKEQQTNMRVIFLEQDNLRLKTEVTMLRNEVEKLRELLYNRKDDKMNA
ncbi:cell death specification protein-like protein [Leptotrombidium deliense]|uniref:Cell death specification protein-like protein n=1 Tax=Leptotrombidium deliense TaxID=299467 RepID=A0A443SQ63_9ACAR|nr:cell death specification protein-like protein [Leptotrombidium deliense]